MAATNAAAKAKAPAKVVASMNDLPRREFWVVVTAGFLLAMTAGFINAATMVGLFGSTVSHVTGTLTRLGVKTVQGQWDTVIRETCILLGFIFGAFIGGIILRNSKFKFTRRYGAALLAESFFLFMTMVAIYSGSYAAPILGAFSCGLQNAIGTVYSAAILRTTHVTGTATDIGMILGQNLAVEAHHDLWKLYVLVPLLVGYFIGALIGTAAYRSMDYLAFFLPATFVLLLGIGQLLLIQFRIVRYQRIGKGRFASQRAARAAGGASPAVAPVANADQAPPPPVPQEIQLALQAKNQELEVAAAAASPAAAGVWPYSSAREASEADVGVSGDAIAVLPRGPRSASAADATSPGRSVRV